MICFFGGADEEMIEMIDEGPFHIFITPRAGFLSNEYQIVRLIGFLIESHQEKPFLKHNPRSSGKVTERA